MEIITQQFIVHPVGQGLFYSGKIEINNSNVEPTTFNFVFDCGSLNSVNASEEVDLYREETLKDNVDLDLLIISHFDCDHVSHIERLLKSRKVKKVILPFSSIEERLFLLLKHFYDLEEDVIYP